MNEQRRIGVRAIGGFPLEGKKLLRVLYLDETGHDKRSNVTCVAGLIINCDTQWRALAEDVEQLKSYVPEQFQDGFYFHATDLQNGGRYRQTWANEDRWALLDKLIALPRLHNIPIVLGYTTPPTGISWDPKQSIVNHSLAYSYCLMGGDWYMKNHVPNEAAMVVAEERPEAHKAMKAAQNLFSSQKLVDEFLPIHLQDKLPLITRIKAPPAFAAKEDEVLLQISDACAFVFQRFWNKAHGYDRLVDAMFGNRPPLEFEKLRDSAANFGCFYWGEGSGPLHFSQLA